MFFQCPAAGCGRMFVNKKALREHQRTHSQNRPYTCDQCDQSFTQFSSLQKHQRVHDKLKPFTCEMQGCNQSFSQVSNLIRHQRIHTGEKPFLCEVCDKRFSSGSNLKQHMQIHRDQVKRQQYQCFFGECKKSYLYQSSLKKHFLVSHEVEYTKYLSEKKIDSKGFMERKDMILEMAEDFKIRNQIEASSHALERIGLPVINMHTRKGIDSLGGKEQYGNKESYVNLQSEDGNKRKHHEHIQQHAGVAAKTTIEQVMGELLSQKRARFEIQSDTFGGNLLHDNARQLLPGSLIMLPQQTPQNPALADHRNGNLSTPQMATDEQEKHSMTPIFNIQDSIAVSFREPADSKPGNRTPSSSHLSQKKFIEDAPDAADTTPQFVEKPIKISVRKPLPTLKSLSKENKKLQRLLQISLAQRSSSVKYLSNDPKSESVAAANIQMSDSSYNSSLGSELCMNKSLAQDSSPSMVKVKKESSKWHSSQRSLSHKSRSNALKKALNHRSQFFAQENVDLEESELSSGDEDEEVSGDENGDQQHAEEKEELEFQKQAEDSNQVQSQTGEVQNPLAAGAKMRAKKALQQVSDLKNHELSGYHSHESPNFSFNVHERESGKLDCKITAAQKPRDVMSDQRSKSSHMGSKIQNNGVDSNAPKFARISNRNKSDSLQSIKIMRQQEVLLGINQKVRQLNSEFERTLLFANNQEILHKQEIEQKSQVIMAQEQKIRLLCEQNEALIKALKIASEKANSTIDQQVPYNVIGPSDQGIKNGAVTTARESIPNNSNGKHPFTVLKAFVNSINNNVGAQVPVVTDVLKSPSPPKQVPFGPAPAAIKAPMVVTGPSPAFASFNFQHQQNQAVQAQAIAQQQQQQAQQQAQPQQPLQNNSSELEVQLNSMLQQQQEPNAQQFEPNLVKNIILQQQQLIMILNDKIKVVKDTPQSQPHNPNRVAETLASAALYNPTQLNQQQPQQQQQHPDQPQTMFKKIWGQQNSQIQEATSPFQAPSQQHDNNQQVLQPLIQQMTPQMTPQTMLNGFDHHQLNNSAFEGGYDSQATKCFKGGNEKSLTQPHCQSLDPYSLINRMGPRQDKNKGPNERRELDSLALSEFKMNSNQINEQLYKIAVNLPKQDFDHSMSHSFFQPMPRHQQGTALLEKPRTRNSHSSNEQTSFTQFLLKTSQQGCQPEEMKQQQSVMALGLNSNSAALHQPLNQPQQQMQGTLSLSNYRINQNLFQAPQQQQLQQTHQQVLQNQLQAPQQQQQQLALLAKRASDTATTMGYHAAQPVLNAAGVQSMQPGAPSVDKKDSSYHNSLSGYPQIEPSSIQLDQNSQFMHSPKQKMSNTALITISPMVVTSRQSPLAGAGTAVMAPIIGSQVVTVQAPVVMAARNGPSAEDSSQNQSMILQKVPKRKKVGLSQFSKNRGLSDDEDKESAKTPIKVTINGVDALKKLSSTT